MITYNTSKWCVRVWLKLKIKITWNITLILLVSCLYTTVCSGLGGNIKAQKMLVYYFINKF